MKQNTKGFDGELKLYKQKHSLLHKNELKRSF